jgi:sulfur relay (sulfurtransferase) DsrC/TusE family protein
MAHRLELAFKKVTQDNEAQLKVLEFLESIYKFYHNSSLNRSMLRQCSSAFGTTGIPTRYGYLIHTLPSSTSGKCILHWNSILERYVKYTHR